jgi:hypothetical protein
VRCALQDLSPALHSKQDALRSFGEGGGSNKRSWRSLSKFSASPPACRDRLGDGTLNPDLPPALGCGLCLALPLLRLDRRRPLLAMTGHRLDALASFTRKRAPMAKVHAVQPEPGIGQNLPGADFIDAYRVRVGGVGLDAMDAAKQMLIKQPGWVDRLMALRNAIVTPFGLKTGHETDGHIEKIGIFPIESVTPSRVVLGFEDKHLDFRVVIDVVRTGGDSEVTATTLVRRHNLLGRAYLAVILPFHRMVVRALFKNVAKPRA